MGAGAAKGDDEMAVPPQEGLSDAKRCRLSSQAIDPSLSV